MCKSLKDAEMSHRGFQGTQRLRKELERLCRVAGPQDDTPPCARATWSEKVGSHSAVPRSLQEGLYFFPINIKALFAHLCKYIAFHR